MKKSFLKITCSVVVLALIAACNKKLNVIPQNSLNSEVVYASAAGYKSVLAKVYGSFALTGNTGPNGNGDVQGIDEGTSDFLRLYWKAQELSTDEAVVAWGDPGIQDFHNMNWTSDNPMLKGLYYRAFYQITLANEFIRQADDGKLDKRGITGQNADEVRQYKREARYLRAYQYWMLMDLFANPPFADENTTIAGAPPTQIQRAALFTYIENELLAIEPSMPAARTNEYGRADKAAVWALLARMYLNAQVYTGTAKFSEAVTYSKKVIDAGYSLISDYRWLMLADNQQNTSEFIFTINYDGRYTQNWGGTTFLTHASVGGSMTASTYGVDGGWGGIRTTRNIPNLFPDVTGTADKRSQFYTAGQNIDIFSLTTFTDGYAITKYRNRTRTGANGSNLTWTDIDFPIFRLSEMYLIYAESVLRGGTTGDLTTALGYVNAIRTRAYMNASGNITAGQLTLDFILDERARELYWEGFRRTDLVRYNRFVENSYLWPWKGGVAGGAGVAATRKIFPIPSSDVVANPNLTQNPGY
jgi:starch-binding outer membrane protein, SusD/RagB family